MFNNENIKKVEATIDNGSFGKRKITFETGLLAQQADGAVLTYMSGTDFDDTLDGTTILSTTVISGQPKEHFDFFPLTVDVEERMYAAGKIPGSFFRREGRPSMEAILACRLIDRPLRPLFDNRLRNEVQVIESILSANPDDSYDVLAINAASASTLISGIPFEGPVSGLRLALIDGQWVAFPRNSELDRSTFEIVVAGRIINNGSDVAIAMIEAGAGKNAFELIQNGGTKPDEEVVAGALEAAKPFIKVLCEAQSELAKIAAKEVREYPIFPLYSDELYSAVENITRDGINDAYNNADKQIREDKIKDVKANLLERLANEYSHLSKDENGDDIDISIEIGNAFKSVQKALVRQRILRDGYRIDGRGLTDIRPLTAQINVLPRVHGSALFQRGETQIMGVSTLNNLKLEMQTDSLGAAEAYKRYMHNYNFPPYSTGETGRVGSPKRREIGHGALAERALVPVLPSREQFPYAIRQVSEALGSNGSTSMGSVCASTLSLLSAGVPLKASVAGIAMGLASEEIDGETKYACMTDILGAEDAFGDMDFKVAGTSEFITALQLDTKLDGIPSDVLASALKQAKVARLTILDVLNAAISEPAEPGRFTPRIITVHIPTDKIGIIIGPKGANIKAIQEASGAEISIEEDGSVFISCEGVEAGEIAAKLINETANPPKVNVGDVYTGKVTGVAKFGAFVNLIGRTDGLLHVSQMKKLNGDERVSNPEDVVKEGDELEVVVDKIDDGKISLLLK
jgi:polyribonucleotide nucleotidyltransferase